MQKSLDCDMIGINHRKAFLYGNIQEYIQNQLKRDLESDQMTLNEYIDPFTGELVKRQKEISLEG